MHRVIYLNILYIATLSYGDVIEILKESLAKRVKKNIVARLRNIKLK